MASRGMEKVCAAARTDYTFIRVRGGWRLFWLDDGRWKLVQFYPFGSTLTVSEGDKVAKRIREHRNARTSAGDFSRKLYGSE